MRTRATLSFCVLIALVFLVPLQASAASSDVELKILPMNCTFEIVNDGSNRLRYLTPQTCEQAFATGTPTSLTQSPTQPVITPQATANATAVPTNGDNARLTQLPERSAGFTGDKTWSPIASTNQASPIAQQNTRVVLVASGGVGAVAVVTATIIDLAFFEMRHSKSALRWARRLTSRG